MERTCVVKGYPILLLDVTVTDSTVAGPTLFRVRCGGKMFPFYWSCVAVVITVYISVQKCYCTAISMTKLGLTEVPSNISADVTMLSL